MGEGSEVLFDPLVDYYGLSCYGQEMSRIDFPYAAEAGRGLRPVRGVVALPRLSVAAEVTKYRFVRTVASDPCAGNLFRN
jgi:hypothetical protein